MEKLSSISEDFFLAVDIAKPDSAFIKQASNESPVILTSIDEYINPIKLKNRLMRDHGKEWLDWSPETVVFDILDGKANDLLLDKVQAIQLCLTTDTPWIEWNIFEKVGRCFTHQDVDFLTFQPLSSGECSITIDLMQQLREDEQFSEEVELYVANIAFSEHLVCIPKDMFPASFHNQL